MPTGYVLYNTKAGDADARDAINNLQTMITDPLKFVDVTKICDYRIFLTSGIEPEDYIILAGGDGTLNHFINDIDGISFEHDVLYFPIGTGNDFAHDLGFSKGCSPFSIREHLYNLPYVTVQGQRYRFINGVGYGIDGYCCEVGDQLRKIPGKKIDYTAIAIKGMLFHYKSTNAKITVDGKIRTYKNVWIAPTMNGRFYGGGMMPTPDQHRNSGELSALVFHCPSKLNTLRIFPSLFKGEHIRHTKQIAILTGQEITVEFDRPVSLQVDGETFLNVSSYTAQCPNITGNAGKQATEKTAAKKEQVLKIMKENNNTLFFSN